MTYKNLRSACQKEKPLKPYMLVVGVCWDMTMNKTGQFHLWLSSIPIKRHNKKLFQDLCYSCIEKPCYICIYYPRSMLNSQLNGEYCKQMVTILPKPINAVEYHKLQIVSITRQMLYVCILTVKFLCRQGQNDNYSGYNLLHPLIFKDFAVILRALDGIWNLFQLH